MPPLSVDMAFNSRSLICGSCRFSAGHLRSFSTTSSRSNIGPESPRYIDIPQSVQAEYEYKLRVKGVLPVPREIFPRRRPDKPSPLYLAEATPEPSAKHAAPSPDAPHVELVAWRKRMAAMRRKNLREGLLELYQRKDKNERRIAARSNYKQSERDNLVHQSQREDERLTNSTVLQAMQPVQGPLSADPNREARLAASRARTEAHLARAQERRQDALQTLYLNARSFITTEEQLQAEIEKVFPADDDPSFRTTAQPGTNIWNLGPPPNVNEKLSAIFKGDKTLAQSQGGSLHGYQAQKRMREIADVLGFKKKD